MRRQKAITTFYIGTTLLRVGCFLPVLYFEVGSNMCEAPDGGYVHEFRGPGGVRDVNMPIDRGTRTSVPEAWKVHDYSKYRATLCNDEREREPPSL